MPSSHLSETGRRPTIAQRRWRLHPCTSADRRWALLLALVALLARLPFVFYGETLLHSDEAIVGLMAQDIAEGRVWPLYFYGQRYMGALEAYVVALASFVCDDPLVALRLGPACFLSALVAVEYLMLTRWFGARAALLGAATLIVGSPMFVQWSIAARGGYVEIFLVGTSTWWAYSEWIAGRAEIRRTHQGLLGFLVGLGFWINPMMVGFVAPIAAHAVLERRWRSWLTTPSGIRLRDASGAGRWRGVPIAAPLLLSAAVVGFNLVQTIEVTPGGIERRSLFGLAPAAFGSVALLIAGCVAFVALRRRFGSTSRIVEEAMRPLNSWAPFVAGLFAGSTPAIGYTASRLATGRAMDDALPIGLRPLSTLGRTAEMAFDALPLLFGADPWLSVRWLLPGRDFSGEAIPEPLAWAVPASGWAIAAGMLTIGFLVLRRGRREIDALMRLCPRCYSPFAFLLMAAIGFVSAFLLSSVAFDFSSIRYLLPLWTVLPGLLAAAAADRRAGRVVWIAASTLLVCWGFGQAALATLCVTAHPLRAVAERLGESPPAYAVAEFQDAQYLSYLSGQRAKICEYRPFWPRLRHFEPPKSFSSTSPSAKIALLDGEAKEGPSKGASRSVAYIFPDHPQVSPPTPADGVGTARPTPPELVRRLRRDLIAWTERRPELVLERRTLPAGYALWLLSEPLPDDPRAFGSQQVAP